MADDEHRRFEELPRRTPEPDAGSAAPKPDETPADARDELDPDLLAEGGALPRTDALEQGEPGAPKAGLGTDAGHGPGPGAYHEGGAGGSGVLPAAEREQGAEERRGQDEPAEGGPPEPE